MGGECEKRKNERHKYLLKSPDVSTLHWPVLGPKSKGRISTKVWSTHRVGTDFTRIPSCSVEYGSYLGQMATKNRSEVRSDFHSTPWCTDRNLWFVLLQTIATTHPKAKTKGCVMPSSTSTPQAVLCQWKPRCPSQLESFGPTYVSQIAGNFYFTYEMVRICLLKLSAPLGAFSGQCCREKNRFKPWFCTIWDGLY